MANITIHSTAQTAEGGGALHLTVRGCEVLALFAPEKNATIYHNIRRTLMDSCLNTNVGNKTAKIGQNERNVR